MNAFQVAMEQLLRTVREANRQLGELNRSMAERFGGPPDVWEEGLSEALEPKPKTALLPKTP